MAIFLAQAWINMKSFLEWMSQYKEYTPDPRYGTEAELQLLQKRYSRFYRLFKMETDKKNQEYMYWELEEMKHRMKELASFLRATNRSLGRRAVA